MPGWRTVDSPLVFFLQGELYTSTILRHCSLWYRSIQVEKVPHDDLVKCSVNY